MNKVYYSAYCDEIWLCEHPFKVIRGCQGKIKTEFNGGVFYVEDALELFTWNADKDLWREHLKNGWLIDLGEL